MALFKLNGYFSIPGHSKSEIENWSRQCFRQNAVSFSQAQRNILLLQKLLMRDHMKIASSLRDIKQLCREVQEALALGAIR